MNITQYRSELASTALQIRKLNANNKLTKVFNFDDTRSIRVVFICYMDNKADYS